MKMRLLSALVMVLFMLALVPGAARADGFVVIDEPGDVPSAAGVRGTPVPLPPIIPPAERVMPYLSVKYNHVTITIRDQVAQTKVDQVFVNDRSVDLEGTYIFPLPQDASVSNFAMYVDGKKMEGQILTKEQARSIYEQTVSKRRDPALLEYVGRGAFQARVFPIPAHGERRIQIEYTQVLDRNNDLVHLVYPLSTEKLSPQPLQQLSIDVTISGREAIKAIYSSSHDVAISRKGETTAVVSYEATNVRPDKDFSLYYSLAPGDMGASLLTYRSQGEDGYFLLLVTPRTEIDTTKVAAKDVILVLDTSGSMQGQKIDQAKDALGFILDRLNVDDRFALIAFNTGINRFRDGLSTLKDREAAHSFVDAISASGSTNINDALVEALKGADPERPTVLIFLTDGLPTTGITDAGRIVANIGKVAPASLRFFTFGVGYDVNTSLLDTLAANHRGASAYVKPGENIEDAVSAFYARISKPVLTDISLDFGGMRVADLYPTPLPDLFAGSQLVLTGRYRSSGATTITLKGTVNTSTQQFTYSDLSFPQQTGGETAFIARLWATRRIGYLVTQIRLNGTNKEIVDEIVSLGLRYGIVTPYTSFLVDERQNVFAPGAQLQAGEALNKSLAAPAPTAGAAAVQDSETLRRLRDAAAAPTAPPAAAYAAGGPAQSSAPAQAQVKAVADKTFLQRNGAWVDTQYNEGMKTVDVGFGSDDYFKLLAARPEWGQYFALGQRMTVVLDDIAYRVSEGSFAPLVIPASSATPTPARAEPVQATPVTFFDRLWRWIAGFLSH